MVVQDVIKLCVVKMTITVNIKTVKLKSDVSDEHIVHVLFLIPRETFTVFADVGIRIAGVLGTNSIEQIHTILTLALITISFSRVQFTDTIISTRVRVITNVEFTKFAKVTY